MALGYSGWLASPRVGGDKVSGYGRQGMAAFLLEEPGRHTEFAEKPLSILGRVRVGVSDFEHSDAGSGTPTDFMVDPSTPLPDSFGTGGAGEASVLVMRDYYPFGMEIPERVCALPGAVYQRYYCYGFNMMGGKKQVEAAFKVKGEGMSYDFGARVYDPRVGRWCSCDLLEGKALSWSGYPFAFDNPMRNIGPVGMFENHDLDDAGNYLGTDGDPKSKSIRVISRNNWNNLAFGLGSVVDEAKADFLKNSTLLNEDSQGIDSGDQTQEELAYGFSGALRLFGRAGWLKEAPDESWKSLFDRLKGK